VNHRHSALFVFERGCRAGLALAIFLPQSPKCQSQLADIDISSTVLSRVHSVGPSRSGFLDVSLIQAVTQLSPSDPLQGVFWEGCAPSLKSGGGGGEKTEGGGAAAHCARNYGRARV
jgi:hypothetical protein